MQANPNLAQTHNVLLNKGDEMSIKVHDIVSKITLHSDTPEEIGKAILDHVKSSGPVVIYKDKPFHKGGTDE